MRRRLCAECGAELIPEGMVVPGAEACGQCGAQRLRVAETWQVAPAPQAPPVEEAEVFTSEDGSTTFRRVRQGPFVFQQYTRTVNGGGPGCGCGCLLFAFLVYLVLRGFVSLF